MIAVFMEGGKIMIGADKQEFDSVDYEGGKLKITSPERAFKLAEAITELAEDWNKMKSIDNNECTEEEVNKFVEQFNRRQNPLLV